MKLVFCLLCCALCPTTAFRGASDRNALRGSSVVSEWQASGSTADLFADSLISGDGKVRFSHAIEDASKHVDVNEAADILRQKHVLSKEVSYLLTKSSTNNSQALTEESLTKARQFLNGLVEAAYKELDDKVIEAKEFQDRNRGTWMQVVADIARLGQQIAEHMRLMHDATSCIAGLGAEIDSVKSHRQEEYDAYMKVYNVNYADLQIKQNDLDVFDFLIKTTKKLCDEQEGLLFADVGHRSTIQVCNAHDGATLRFSDVALQAKFDRMLMKGSRDLIKNALMRTQVSKSSMSLLQKGDQQVVQPLKAATAKVPVTQGQNDEFGDMKCGPIPDCGLLYDTLSLEWGGYKDQVDELKKQMSTDAAAWATLKGDLDAQIASLTAAQDECVSQLAESTANKNVDQSRLAEKTEEKRDLDEEHRRTMNELRQRIKYIFNQDICGPTVIRNEVMKESTDCAPKNIDDCDVGDWLPAVCSVACDDGCPEAVGCGGTQTLTREVLVTANHCGIKCPELSVIRKCNQFKCPVDCLMSRWSGWSKCSKDCEGGVRARTRSVITKPKNGGKACSAVSDGRPCETESCDRKCSLFDWTAWSPCSMACGGGNQYRVKDVDIPIRGGGTCPKPSSNFRLQNQDCNTQECTGDEICIATQDLIINVDGSGSVNTESWNLVKNFTGELLKRYKAKYYGNAAVHIGVVLFGNGVIESDGTVSKAALVSELVDDLAAVKTAVAAMGHQKGFTNMAQGFVLSQKLLTQKGRKDAQSAIMTISDGKPSFLFETTEKAKALEDKGIMKFMVAIAPFPGSDEWKLMKALASKPANTNTVRVPGFDALQDGGGPFVREAIAKFCPMAMSPSQTLEVEVSRGYMLVYKKGYCGNLGETLSHKTYKPEDCRMLAAEKGATGFSMGRKFRAGKCCVELLPFTCDQYDQWRENPADPQCHESGSGRFYNSRYYDWYAIEPNCAD